MGIYFCYIIAIFISTCIQILDLKLVFTIIGINMQLDQFKKEKKTKGRIV